MRRKFEGDLYEVDGEEIVFPGGVYSVDWGRTGVTSDFDMNYGLEHVRSGFSLEAYVVFDYSGTEPVIEDAEVRSDRESFDGIEIETFQEIWEDVRAGTREIGSKPMIGLG